jgi:hypothetical protein
MIFFFCKPGLSSRIFCLVWLKVWNNISGYCFTLIKIINKQNAFSILNTNAINFPADGTDLVFFGAEQPASLHRFDCCLDSGV